MFALGLEFSLPKLTRVGLRAAVAGLAQILVMLVAGYELGGWLGWSRADRIFLGAMLSISSTTIIIKVLMDLKVEREDFAQVVFGILIIEDIAATLYSALGIDWTKTIADTPSGRKYEYIQGSSEGQFTAIDEVFG